MKGLWKPLFTGLALAALTLAGGQAQAQLYKKAEPIEKTAPLPKPAEVKSLAVYPTKVTLKGLDDSAQLIVTATLTDGKLVDLTSDVTFEVKNAKVGRVTSAGRVIPLTNGDSEIVAIFGDKTISLPIKTQSCDVSLPINFTNDVVPIFTKLGCNSGGCHGKSGGQNGFQLSLLGFEPDIDFSALVKEDRGRRVFPAAPDHSLLLLKATGTMAHAGGKRMDVGSDEYKLIYRWIASGMPLGKETDPHVTKITVYPEHRILTRNGKQQFAVYAHYSDNTLQDVTQRAQFESNAQDVAIVDGAALVRALDMSGEAAIMARYQSQVAVFRATVPLGMKIPDYKWEPKTLVDTLTQKKWKELGVVPSELCGDEEFMRRVHLDLTGTLPTPAEVKAFLADKSPNKRDTLIDALLERPEYSYYFANKWADVLKVKRGNQPGNASGTFAFHSWIREAVANDLPYDKFVRGILAASGDEYTAPPTVWYKSLTKPEEFVDDTAQVFLGLRIACAQCHHHPYEKWSQEDYWSMAAFFGQVGKKNVPVIGGLNNQKVNKLMVYHKGTGTVNNKKTGKVADMVPLDSGSTVKLTQGEDPRHKLVDWMVSPTNPYFAKAVVNRYWAHFFGRGLVDPIDDMRITNPPTNPELLNELAQDLIKNKFSLKHLIKTLVKSRTYQLSATPNEYNKHDKQAYARFYPRRMSAEVLFDAVNQVTDAPATFNGLPTDKFAPNKAIMLPDEGFQSYFLDVFGRPQRLSACECERVSEANLAQALHLLNSNEVQGKIMRGGGRAEQLAKDMRPDAEKVKELFVWCFAREPSPQHLQVAMNHIQKHSMNKARAYGDLMWALINTKEFIFNK